MSRIARMPIEVPAGVEIKISDRSIDVKGALGALNEINNPLINIDQSDGSVTVSAAVESKASSAMAGTFRALIANMVEGVTKGFEKKLTLVGVGYRAQVQGQSLNLQLGFSHPVVHKLPDGVKAEMPSQTEIVIKGASKQRVGQVAAEVRAYRPPEPYKGKGVRYSDERITLKETKKK